MNSCLSSPSPRGSWGPIYVCTDGSLEVLGLNLIQIRRFCIYYTTIFKKIGCQGDRTPMYKGLAPCLMVTEGDRRVTGCTSLKTGCGGKLLMRAGASVLTDAPPALPCVENGGLVKVLQGGKPGG